MGSFWFVLPSRCDLPSHCLRKKIPSEISEGPSAQGKQFDMFYDQKGYEFLNNIPFQKIIMTMENHSV